MRGSKVWRVLIVAIAGGALLSGCFWPPPSTDPDPDPEPVPALERISVSPNGASVYVGATQQFIAFGHYADEGIEDITDEVTWSSSNGSIPISNVAGTRGLATANAAGTTTITASRDEVSGTTPFSAIKEVESVVITPGAADAPELHLIGATTSFTLTATYVDGSTEDVTQAATWSTTDAFITMSHEAGSEGTVTRTGHVWTEDPVAAPITATFGGKSDSSAVSLRPIDVKGFLFEPEVLSLATVGSSLDLKVIANLFGGGLVDVTEYTDFSTTSPGITVSNAAETKGRVTRTSATAGTATVTIDYAGYDQDVTVQLP